MITTPIRTIAAVAAVLAASTAVAACSSSNTSGPSKAQVKDALSAVQTTGGQATTPANTTPAAPLATTPATTPETTTPQAAAADGKAVFAENCAACHTLKAAGASGTAGPNLDTLKPSAATVAGQVTKGGGAMPAFGGQLSLAEIKAVAAYVSSSAGG